MSTQKGTHQLGWHWYNPVTCISDQGFQTERWRVQSVHRNALFGLHGASWTFKLILSKGNLNIKIKISSFSKRTESNRKPGPTSLHSKTVRLE